MSPITILYYIQFMILVTSLNQYRYTYSCELINQLITERRAILYDYTVVIKPGKCKSQNCHEGLEFSSLGNLSNNSWLILQQGTSDGSGDN